MLGISLIIGASLGLLLLGGLYIKQTVFNPHKLDSIKILLANGKYDQVISTLTAIIKKDDKDPAAHLYLAEAYFFNNNPEMAMVEYKQVLNAGRFSGTPTEKVIRKRLAEIYLKYGQLEESQKEYIILSKLEPHNADYLFQIGSLFYQRGLKEQSLAYLDKAIKAGKATGDVYFLIGKIYFELNKATESLNYLTLATQLDPNNHEAHYYCGLILKAMGSNSKALMEFEFCEQSRDNRLKVKSIYQKGLCKLEVGELEGAKTDFERALKYSIDDSNVSVAIRYTLGLTYEKERRLVEAVEQWEKVAQMKPNFQDVQVKLAEYEDLRADDKLKDMLTSTPTTFEIISQKLLKNLGYETLESKLMNDDNIEIVGMEKSVKWRNIRGGKVLVRLSRDNEEINEDQIAKLVENLKLIHGIRAIYISTGKFTPQAVRYSENRPVDLYDRQRLTATFKQMRL